MLWVFRNEVQIWLAAWATKLQGELGLWWEEALWVSHVYADMRMLDDFWKHCCVGYVLYKL